MADNELIENIEDDFNANLEDFRRNIERLGDTISWQKRYAAAWDKARDTQIIDLLELFVEKTQLLFVGCNITKEKAWLINGFLCQSSDIHTLDLDGAIFDDVSLSIILKGLYKNKIISTLYFGDSEIGEKSAQELIKLLQYNRRIICLLSNFETGLNVCAQYARQIYQHLENNRCCSQFYSLVIKSKSGSVDPLAFHEISLDMFDKIHVTQIANMIKDENLFQAMRRFRINTSIVEKKVIEKIYREITDRLFQNKVMNYDKKMEESEREKSIYKPLGFLVKFIEDIKLIKKIVKNNEKYNNAKNRVYRSLRRYAGTILARDFMQGQENEKDENRLVLPVEILDKIYCYFSKEEMLFSVIAKVSEARDHDRENKKRKNIDSLDLPQQKYLQEKSRKKFLFSEIRLNSKSNIMR